MPSRARDGPDEPRARLTEGGAGGVDKPFRPTQKGPVEAGGGAEHDLIIQESQLHDDSSTSTLLLVILVVYAIQGHLGAGSSSYRSDKKTCLHSH